MPDLGRGRALTRRHEFMEEGNARRPGGDEEKGKYHLGQDAAVHSHENRPFRVFLEVARPRLRGSRALAVCSGVNRPVSGYGPGSGFGFTYEIIVQVQAGVLATKRVRSVNAW